MVCAVADETGPEPAKNSVTTAISVVTCIILRRGRFIRLASAAELSFDVRILGKVQDDGAKHLTLAWNRLRTAASRSVAFTSALVLYTPCPRFRRKNLIPRL